jgi:hypothetical protein
MQTLILGRGEIGTALANVLKQYNPIVKTKTNDRIDGIEIMHICFQYSNNFVKEVKRYQELYKPKYTVIHSTVPVGTNRQLNSISSPCLGVHPYLEESLKTFTKFLGGKQAGDVADYFRRANIKVHLEDKTETTELLKLLCTTKYGIDIEYVKDVKNQCDKYGVPFDSWMIWNDNYNRGYYKLGQEQFMRPNLIPIMNKIGGHCVLPNAKIFNTKFTKLLNRLNKGENKHSF